MAEHPLVAEAHAIARGALQPPLSIERGAPLLYAVTVNNALQVTVDPKKPVRGQSAFETDLCVFEQKTDDIKIPRLVPDPQALDRCCSRRQYHAAQNTPGRSRGGSRASSRGN